MTAGEDQEHDDVRALDRAVAETAQGLWRWLRQLALAMHRLEGFVFRETDEASGASLRELASGVRAEELAREFVLRALRLACDPETFLLLRRLRVPDPPTIAEMAHAFGLGRLVMVERINSLVQAGLVSRDLEADRARLTGLGEGVVGILEQIVAASTQHIAGHAPELAERLR